MPEIIGLIGRARTGKDTIADHLIRRRGFVKMAMADPLREMARSIDPVVGWIAPGTTAPGGWPIEPGPIYYSQALDDYGYEVAKDRFPEFRRFLQRLGTEGIRGHVSETFWVDEAERRIRASGAPVVVTDVRFENEARLIRRLGGTLAYVTRSHGANIADAVALTTHASEDLAPIAQAHADVRIDNDGDIRALYAQVDHKLPGLNIN